MQIRISKYIDDHVGEMITVLSKLVSIPSVRGKAVEGMPYGEAPAKALETMLNLAEKMGFTVKNYDNYVGTIDFDPKKETTLGMLCHLDVVPAGQGWTNPPFTLTLSGGKLYGRGAADDKGPAVAVLFALRALRDCGYDLSQNVRFIVGCDEECGSSDLRYYKTKEKLPPRVFTPDGSFPVINFEKGMIRAGLTRTLLADGKKTVVSAEGGTVVNAVPDRATALLRGFTTEELEKAKAALPKEITAVYENENGDIRVTVKGKSAHASTPEGGINAATALFMLLGALPADDETASFFASLSKLFPYGETDGNALNIAITDEKTGSLTLVFSVFHFENGCFVGKFDSRFPNGTTSARIRTKAEKAFAKAKLTIDEWNGVAPHYVDEESDFVKTLLTVYTEISHKRGYTLAIGGGTYVHDVEGGVAFGAEFPGVESRMHGADENVSMENFILSTKIFAEAILRLCQ